MAFFLNRCRCRLILICENISKVLDPVRSRCVSIRVPAPSNEQIMSVLAEIAIQENIEVPRELLENIATASARNMRRAILMLESCRVQQYGFVVFL